jgi:hypothetical protein
VTAAAAGRLNRHPAVRAARGRQEDLTSVIIRKQRQVATAGLASSRRLAELGVSPGHSSPAARAWSCLTRAGHRPVVWPHEIPDSGISHRNTGSSPCSGTEAGDISPVFAALEHAARDFTALGTDHSLECSSPPSDTWGLKSLGTQAQDSVGACEQGHATARERLSIPARAMRSHRRGENVVTITSLQPRSTNSARAMMHSARDLETRLRIDLAIQIGSAIEPVPHAHAQVNGRSASWRRSGSAVAPHKKPRSWTRSPRSVWCTRTCP